MSRVADQLSSLAPALAFLLTGVPLAVLLDRLGFFEAAAAVVTSRSGRAARVLPFWVFAALTTVVLNLDTTVVLLTPLYFRVARRADIDPFPMVVIPLLLASLASSVLPVSNLTNLIVADKLHVGAAAMLTHLALPSFVATAVGWLMYRRRFPTRFAPGDRTAPDARALRIGSVIVAALLIAFVLGPAVGVEPWMSALVADVVLVAITRALPWREVPLLTAVGVAAIAALIAVVVPADALTAALHHDSPQAVAGLTLSATGVANVVNNLPALLVAVDGLHRMTWGMWGWLLGVNTGAALLPLGALANLLWLRIMRSEGEPVGVRRYAAVTVPVVVPALVAAVLTLCIERLVAG